MKALVVVGLGFGDEGKGLATDYLCKNAINPIVIRFNGGHQAGHTVVTQTGLRHTFSNFGSGTFRQVPTYWSSYCTFFPEGVITEFETLGIKPKLLIDYDCNVTTHYDILYNRAFETSLQGSQRGSCGLGYGATVSRSHFPYLNLKVSDLLDKSRYVSRLQDIKSYYREKVNRETSFDFDQFDHDSQDKRFISQIEQIHALINNGFLRIVSVKEVLSQASEYKTFIFEGAQGIMLDQSFGFNPYITKSNTTSQNALQLIKENLPEETEVEITYVTRCYHTRHGAGPLSTSSHSPLFKLQNETNIYNEFQREFRVSFLDINILNYALKCDSLFSISINKHLVVTCVDQLFDENLQCYVDGKLKTIKYYNLPQLLNCKFSQLHFSFSSCSADLEKF